jgi:hypothetical protein
MTPDDMEAVVERVEALVLTYGDNTQYDAFRTLLLDYQERGRALRFYADEHEYPSDGPWGVNSDDFGKVARATLKGKSHD